MESGVRGVWRLPPGLALGLTILLGSSSLAWGVEVADLVQRYGLEPIEPPRPAADFELPGIDGGVRSLSDSAGAWTVLTFWASWCGPCRSEMPSLEQIHRWYGEKGVVVLGVSVDRTASAARAFIDEHGLTFPQLWDRDGRVGATYQAVAIPLSYLLDPRGRLVATARGARDWTEVAGLIDALIDGASDESAGDTVYAPVADLSDVVEPPTAEVLPSSSSPEVGEPFFVDVRLQWTGRIDEYLPQPPKIFLPEGIIERGVTASSSSRDGAQVVVYRIGLEADRPGRFLLDPIELRYQPPMAREVATTRVAGPEIEVAPRALLGFRPGAVAATAGTAVLASALGVLFLRRRRGSEPTESDLQAQRFEELSARHAEARQLRMKGDSAGFALTMLEILGQLEEPTGDEAAAREKLEEGYRFGGRKPSAGEMDHLQRLVSRRLEVLRPDPAAATRAALQNHEDEEIA